MSSMPTAGACERDPWLLSLAAGAVYSFEPFCLEGLYGARVAFLEEVADFGHVVGGGALGVEVDEQVGLGHVGNGVGDYRHCEGTGGDGDDAVVVVLLVEVVEVEGYELVAVVADGGDGEVHESTAVDVVVAVDGDGVENHRDGAGGHYYGGELALGEDLDAAQFEVGGDDAGGDGKVFEALVGDVLADVLEKGTRVEQAALRDVRGDDVPEEGHPRKDLDHLLGGVAGRVEYGGERTGAGAGKDVGLDAELLERLQRPAMGPRLGAAAAEGKSCLVHGHTVCYVCKYRKFCRFYTKIPMIMGFFRGRKTATFADKKQIVPMDNIEPSDIVHLNNREQEILRLLAKGLSTRKIAEEIHLGTETVIWYRKRLHKKFKVHSTVELVFKAVEQNIL